MNQEISYFRFILVKFAEGFVQNGYPNLKLFDFLYWIVLLIMISNNCFYFPKSKQLQNGFPQNSIKGKDEPDPV